jgi:hypothetical protein
MGEFIVIHVLSMAAVLPLLAPASIAGPVAPAAVVPIAPDAPHLRPTGPAERALVTTGLARSVTVAALVRDLERADVVVYVSFTTNAAARGARRFITRAGGWTYLRIEIDRYRGETERIGVLAHELRHAIEIAHAPTPIASTRALAALYRLIGYPCGTHGFESAAALTVEVQVVRELAAPTPVTPRR